MEEGQILTNGAGAMNIYREKKRGGKGGVNGQRKTKKENLDLVSHLT